ncbi:MAG: AEC family transporter [Clostridia bacterium]|jgi:hypothetical protein
MDAQVNTIITSIITLGLLGMTGYIVGKTGYLPQKTGNVLSGIVIKVTTPILIFTTMVNAPFTSKDFSNGLLIYLFGLLFILIAFFAGSISTKAMGIKGSAASIYKMQSMFGNVIFLAFPLLYALYGNQGIIYAIFFNLANDTFLWTLGIYLVNSHKKNNWRKNLRHLINGNTMAFAGGLICIYIGQQKLVAGNDAFNHFYAFFYNTFNPLGRTTIYLSMLFIGLILSGIKIKSMKEFLKKYPLFVVSFFKLLAIPFAAIAYFYFFGKGIDKMVKNIVVLQLAMPCSTIVPGLAIQHGSDYNFATEAVFVSTILGLITMPFLVNVLRIFS